MKQWPITIHNKTFVTDIVNVNDDVMVVILSIALMYWLPWVVIITTLKWVFFNGFPKNYSIVVSLTTVWLLYVVIVKRLPQLSQNDSLIFLSVGGKNLITVKPAKGILELHPNISTNRWLMCSSRILDTIDNSSIMITWNSDTLLALITPALIGVNFGLLALLGPA